ncbi:MAG: T9SS type A sorting domain-containing protein, partial [Cruoricaptor ignavus]|nr:T9SS type A sorting domain-containing protein [Cruoricaptor ignavus]
GTDAVVTVTDGALVYNGGGLQVVDKGAVSNTGDIMLVGETTDKLTLDTGSNFTLVFDESDTTKKTYGQLYVSGISQGNITGYVNKQYKANSNHGETARQQLGLPFFEYTLRDLNADLGGYLNITNNSLTAAGRWSPNSVFWWQNSRARFFQLIGETTKVGNPSTYFAVPRRKSDGNVEWNAETALTTFKGVPVSDNSGLTTAITLETSTVDYGANGNGQNFYRERYNTYLDDHFHTGTKWTGTYGKNISQFANPFLTNLDLYNINNITGLNISDVEGIAYYESGNSWSRATGTNYDNTQMVIAKTSGGAFQAGDADKLLIKPLGAVLIKFNTAVTPNVNLNGARKFANTITVGSTSTNPTGRSASTIAADKLVKQLAVVALDADNNELGRTYYAVSPSAVTGKSENTSLQATFEKASIYTREEISEGGLDESSTTELYINEANEIDYKGKEIPLVVSNPEVKKFKFVVYEGGKVVDALSNGNDFFIGNGNTITKADNTQLLTVNNTADYKLYYGTPINQVLDLPTVATKGQTVIAKNQNDWIIRFASTWKSAKVEVYSATGQLVHSANNVSTAVDYVVPMGTSKGLYLVKTTSESGETVIKKIVK